jgi:2-iminobutanoate/2-iminopropanoate deaminase
MKTVITTDAGARPVGPYSQAIRANGLIFVSGQIPFDPETAAIVDGVLPHKPIALFAMSRRS